MAQTRTRIAVIGTGISGLVAAHKLHPAHDVTVYEANGYIGGHTNTVRVDLPDETQWVDTGFIVLNDRNYPNFRSPWPGRTATAPSTRPHTCRRAYTPKCFTTAGTCPRGTTQGGWRR